ncbi:hypothetical protein ABIF07_005488 [Bradyrhizobium elkanii]|uniref:hypothetical protein n=1 Tax=Bradyrhizobium elkanii TaxID=29448 RepID=UPI00216A025B|nr:hypothetical protein [Bradyrhizobium elkanii]MCS3687485.1 hypothetical protein [Bradyrhizobium elkanii]
MNLGSLIRQHENEERVETPAAVPASGTLSAGTVGSTGGHEYVESVNPVLPGKTDPAAFAAHIAGCVRSGVRAEIHAYVLVVDGLRAYEGDPTLSERFLRALVVENLIPKRSARLGLDKSKVSMLRKIGNSAELLLDYRIFKYLRPGRSLLYHVVLLYEALPGTHAERISLLVALFESEGQVSRRFLIDQIKRAEIAAQHPKAEERDPWQGETTFESFDLILGTVGPREARRLSEDPADRLPRCQRVHEHISEDSVFVGIARLADLMAVESKLLPGCGFGAISRVFLLREPVEPNVTDAQVIVVAMRGNSDRVRLNDCEWLPPDARLDPVALALRLFPDAKNKLHLFAHADTAGWCSIVGEANWSLSDV